MCIKPKTAACSTIAAAIPQVLVTTGKLRYTILLHFAFNAGSYLMTLLWFVNTPLDVVITVAIAGIILVEAMRSLRQACQPVATSVSLR